MLPKLLNHHRQTTRRREFAVERFRQRLLGLAAAIGEHDAWQRRQMARGVGIVCESVRLEYSILAAQF